MEKFSAHLPSILAGPTNGSAPEHPIANKATNHTDLTERIGISREGLFINSISHDDHRIAI